MTRHTALAAQGVQTARTRSARLSRRRQATAARRRPKSLARSFLRCWANRGRMKLTKPMNPKTTRRTT
eukprot:7352556-Prorocentrum_lima.AAC.1